LVYCKRGGLNSGEAKKSPKEYGSGKRHAGKKGLRTGRLGFVHGDGQDQRGRTSGEREARARRSALSTAAPVEKDLGWGADREGMTVWSL